MFRDDEVGRGARPNHPKGVARPNFGRRPSTTASIDHDAEAAAAEAAGTPHGFQFARRTSSGSIDSVPASSVSSRRSSSSSARTRR